MWVSKEGDVRRRELLDAALALFYEKGCEKTSINDIIDRVGVSKGAFYYYFNSKEDVLEAIAVEYAERILAAARPIVGDDRLSAAEKLNSMVSKVLEYKETLAKERTTLMRVFLREENLKLVRRIFVKMMAPAGELYTEIIKQGVREGVFDTGSPEDTAELFIYVGTAMKAALAKLVIESQDIKAIERKLLFYEEAFERILGAPKGTIRFAEPMLECIKSDWDTLLQA